MSIDSTSTVEEAKAQLQDNLDYESAGSVAKARLYIEACNWLRGTLPATSTETQVAGTTSVTYDQQSLKDMIADARAFIDNTGDLPVSTSALRVRQLVTRGIRDE